MSSLTTVTVESSSPEQTEATAEQLGSQLRGGEVIELISDLGGGKTTFTRGLLRGTGSTDKVSSPTFTINKEYTAPHFTVSHFDFYRLSEAGIIGNELAEVLSDKQYVTVIEWGDIVHDVLPENRLRIRLEQQPGDSRLLHFDYPDNLTYLFV